MSFTDLQLRKLKSKLKPQFIRVRETEGQTLHYLEGWHVVAEANRIFGFDAWDRETVSNTCVWTKLVGARYCAAYVARVRITVRAGDAVIVREGCGSGESSEATPGQAHDRASKAAETDATKRALTTFGNSFGLTLYGGVAAHQLPSGSSARSRSRETNGATLVLAALAPMGSAIEQQQPVAPLDANGHVAAPHNPESVGPSEALNSAGVPAVFNHAAAHLGLGEPAKPSEDDQGAETPSGRIDKSLLAIAEPRRVRDPAHLKYVAEQPCIICGRQPCEAHHLRYSQPRALGRKSSDAFTVPLCALHHRELHAQGNERAWWVGRGRDPMPVADELWRNSRRDERRM